MLRVRELAERLDVTQHTVLHWIQNGELKAVNVSRNPGGKPSWRIDPDGLEAFRLSRMPQPPTPRSTRRRKRDDVDLEYEYY